MTRRQPERRPCPVCANKERLRRDGTFERHPMHRGQTDWCPASHRRPDDVAPQLQLSPGGATPLEVAATAACELAALVNDEGGPDRWPRTDVITRLGELAALRAVIDAELDALTLAIVNARRGDHAWRGPSPEQMAEALGLTRATFFRRYPAPPRRTYRW